MGKRDNGVDDLEAKIAAVFVGLKYAWQMTRDPTALLDDAEQDIIALVRAASRTKTQA